MGDRNYIVIDAGTGNSKVALVSSEGHIHEVISFENKYYKDYTYKDAQYFLPSEWEQNILYNCKEVINRNKNIKVDAVISTSARQSIVLFDNNFKSFLGLPNIDNRGKEWVEEIPEKAEIYKKTGRWVTEDFPAAKLLGLKKKYPEVYDRIHTFTSVSEWIGSIFTGEISIESSQACETQLYDINRGKWDDSLCEYYGISNSILPDINLAGSQLGLIKSDILKCLNLDDSVVFIIGGADTQMALKGIDLHENEFGIISGTTSPVVTINKSILHDFKERCWVNVNLASNNYVIETNPGVTGLNYQRLKNLFAPNLSYRSIESELSKADSYKCTISLTSLDFANKKSLGYGGIVLTSPLNTMGDVTDILWSSLGDIACSIFVQYKNLNKMINNNNDYIICGGGGFQSQTLSQMISDLTQKKIKLYNTFQQATTVGAVVTANSFFDNKTKLQFELLNEYVPNENSLIHQYYNEWSDNRKLLSERS